MASSLASFGVLPSFGLNSELVRQRFRIIPRCARSGADPVFSSLELESVALNGTPAPTSTVEKEERSFKPFVGGGNGYSGQMFELEEEKLVAMKEQRSLHEDKAAEKLEVLWDDGFGGASVKDYLDLSKKIIKPDGGPPRWFCPVECGQPLEDSPILLFLPGLDGVGMGLVLHHKTLGRVFEVRCLHIPVQDRTPFEELVNLVEETMRLEYASSPKKPIYLVGDSFGGCLALAVAARNPTIDLVVILVNPATSFGRSQLQPLLPLLEALPDELHFTVPYLLSFVMGEPVKMAMVNIDNNLPPRFQLEQLASNLTGLLPGLAGLADIIPKETLLWKLKLLKSAAAYANSRLHAIRAEVLVLASGKDNMVPSRDEAMRLVRSIRNCRVRHFKDNGHTLLMEEGINLLMVIKGTCAYRRSGRLDYVRDFLPPSMSEFRPAFEQIWTLRYAASSVLYSTLQDGTIVRGLSGVPSKGPVLLVGYHMLMGFELFSLVEEFLREKKVLVRGLAHPVLFAEKMESPTSEFSIIDWMKVFGALPVTPSNLFKLLSTDSFALLYPGGAREALHHKGEQYKCIWPDQPEFVRMAARFGATIVPFGAVGEDDIAEYVLDYKDMMKIPILNDYVRESSRDAVRVREGRSGEVANEELFFPGILPKIPGRIYYLFGKPIETRGREETLKDDRVKANELYLQIKSQVEANMAYLLKKREQDPYRSIFDRIAYRVLHSPMHDIPGFEP